MKIALALVMLASSVSALAAAPKTPITEKVGVTTRTFVPKEARNWRGSAKHALECIVWYPAAESANETEQTIGPPGSPLFVEGKAAPDAPFAVGGGKRPLVLLSHGSGGTNTQMAWLGIALARAGFVAVAMNHPGNNRTEKYTAEGFILWWERATDVSDVLDAMLADKEFSPHIDQRMIGAAGFSAGGYTVMELAGAQTDPSALFELCRAHPETKGCMTPEMREIPGGPEAMLTQTRKSSGESLARASESFADDRIRSVFAIAPALTVTQTPESLHSIHIPVEAVVGDADDLAPADLNADKIAKNTRSAREFVLPGGITHFDFLDVCTDAGRAQLGPYCADASGVDRAAIHDKVSGMAVDFFAKTLKWK